MKLTYRQEVLLGWLLVAGILALLYFNQEHEKNFGAFSISPGGTEIREDHIVGQNLMPSNEGMELRDVAPLRIESPTFIACEVLSSYSGGYYLNYTWHERTDIKYRIAASPEAPKGKYTVSIAFLSGYTHVVSFSIK